MKKSKKVLIGMLITIGVLLVVVIGYVAYVLLSYHRLPDNHSLVIDNTTTMYEFFEMCTTHSIATYQIAFGVYSDDYCFFLVGGQYLRAFIQNCVNNYLY